MIRAITLAFVVVCLVAGCRFGVTTAAAQEVNRAKQCLLELAFRSTSGKPCKYRTARSTGDTSLDKDMKRCVTMHIKSMMKDGFPKGYDVKSMRAELRVTALPRGQFLVELTPRLIGSKTGDLSLSTVQPARFKLDGKNLHVLSRAEISFVFY